MRLVVNETKNTLTILEWDGRITLDVVKLDSRIAQMILKVAERHNYVPERREERKVGDVTISWSGPLNDEEKEMLNDTLNVMGMQAGADQGEIPQWQVDAEVKRLEEKYS